MNVMIQTNTNRPINAKLLSDTDFATKYADRVRKGKTERDRKNGNAQRSYANRAERVEWQGDKRTAVMPARLAGGKGNSSKPVKN